jgi:hypothetical protein
MNQQPNFFSPTDFEKRTELIDGLHRAGTDILLKIKDQYYKTKILKKKEANYFAIYKFFGGTYKDQEVLGSFNSDQGKFYFKGYISTQGDELMLSIQNELFQLVRRNDFRVNLPPDATYVCQILQIGNKKTKQEAKLRNISLGGCLIAIPKESVTTNLGDEIFVKMVIKDFEPERIPCIVRQVKPDTETPDTLLGLQFKDPEAEFLTDLQGALIFLDRTHRHARRND